jgi:group I intron endonuclease
MIFVYIIQNMINNKLYIGQTRDLQSRWREHRYEARQRTSHPLYRAMRKHGIENFKMLELARFSNRKDASVFERFSILCFRSLSHHAGYNIDLGGHLAGKHSAQTRKKIGDAKRGTKHSKESRRKMSESQKGQTRSDQAKVNISTGVKKQWMNPKSRQRKIDGLRKAWRKRKWRSR